MRKTNDVTGRTAGKWEHSCGSEARGATCRPIPPSRMGMNLSLQVTQMEGAAEPRPPARTARGAVPTSLPNHQVVTPSRPYPWVVLLWRARRSHAPTRASPSSVPCPPHSSVNWHMNQVGTRPCPRPCPRFCPRFSIHPSILPSTLPSTQTHQVVTPSRPYPWVVLLWRARRSHAPTRASPSSVLCTPYSSVSWCYPYPNKKPREGPGL